MTIKEIRSMENDNKRFHELGYDKDGIVAIHWLDKNNHSIYQFIRHTRDEIDWINAAHLECIHFAINNIN